MLTVWVKSKLLCACLCASYTKNSCLLDLLNTIVPSFEPQICNILMGLSIVYDQKSSDKCAEQPT